MCVHLSYILCFVAMYQDIGKLLVEWRKHLSEAMAVFVRIPVYRRSSFFSAMLERGVQLCINTRMLLYCLPIRNHSEIALVSCGT